jgi:pyruvate formate lyase activating enzyme
MRIGGFVPLSLSDYPGQVASVVFTQGCNFNCPYCHNAPLIPLWPRASRALEVPEVLAKLGALAGRITGVVVTGGEPTIHADLPEFLHSCRVLGLQTKLDTNGNRPAVIRRLLSRGLLSFVAMDVKGPLDRYSEIARVPVSSDRIAESISLIAGSRVEHEFRTTMDDSLLSEADMEAVKDLIPAGSPFRVQNVRNPPLEYQAPYLTEGIEA